MISIQIQHDSLSGVRVFKNESEVDNVKRAIEWLTEVALSPAILEDQKKQFRGTIERFGIAIVVRPDLKEDQVIFVDSKGQETVIKNINTVKKENIYEHAQN